MVLAAPRADGVNLLVHVAAAPEPAQAAHQAQVAGTELADRKYAEAARGKHGEQGAVLELPDDVVRIRMLGRLTCKSCGAVYSEKFHKLSVDVPCPKCDGVLARRRDDTIEALDQRLSQYHEFTRPITDYYEAAGLLKKVDVRFGRDAVFQLLYNDLYNDLRADS